MRAAGALALLGATLLALWAVAVLFGVPWAALALALVLGLLGTGLVVEVPER